MEAAVSGKALPDWKTGVFSSVLGSFLIALILCGFPLWIVDVSLDYVFDLRLRNHDKSAHLRLDEHLISLKPWGNPDFYLKKVLRTLVLKPLRHQDSLKVLQDMIPGINRRFPDLFTFFLFDAKQQLVPQPGLIQPKYISEKILKILSHLFFLEYGRKSELRKEKGLICPFLDIPEGNIADLDTGTGWFFCSSKPEKSWFFYHLGKKFSLFAQVHRKGYREMMGLSKLLMKPGKSDISTYLVDMNDGSITGKNVAGNAESIRRLVKRFEYEPTQHFRINGWLGSVMVLDSQFRLVSMLPDDLEKSQISLRKNFRSLALVLFLASCFLIRKILCRQAFPYVSIRWKLLSLFLLASGFPILLLISTGVVYLQEREQGFMQESWQRAAEMIRALDNKLPLSFRIIEKQLSALIATADFSSPTALNKLWARLNNFHFRYFSREVRVIDVYGEKILSVDPDNKSGDEAVEEIMGAVHSLVMQAFKANKGDRPEPKGKPKTKNKGMILSAVVEGQHFDRFLNFALRGLGKISAQDIAGNRGYFYANFIRDSAGAIQYLLTTSWNRFDLIRFYFHRYIPVKPQQDGSELMAVLLEEKFIPGGKKSTIDGFPYKNRAFFTIPKRPISRDLHVFFKNLLNSETLNFGKIQYRGAPYLIAGMPGKTVQGSMLMAMIPLESIKSEVVMIRSRLIVLGIFCLGFASFFGLLLAKKFLEPVAELSLGVLAIQEKNFRHRVPEKNDPDELNDLTKIFNNMIENLEEVSIGRQIQEKLLPHEMLTLGEYKVHGVSRPATQLGGDYFDYLAIANRNLLVFIGDVTGHGVPAALVMAMSKATVLNCANNSLTAYQLLESLNSIIFQSMKKKLFMTVGVLWIDTVTHEYSFFNCGHVYPFKRAVDGSYSMLEMETPFLGIRQKFRPAEPISGTLLPGERVIFYTDGLVESYPGLKGTSGFVQFENYLKSRPLLPLEKTCKDILDNHYHTLTGEPQPDDFTVLVVERSSA